LPPTPTYVEFTGADGLPLMRGPETPRNRLDCRDVSAGKPCPRGKMRIWRRPGPEVEQADGDPRRRPALSAFAAGVARLALTP